MSAPGTAPEAADAPDAKGYLVPFIVAFAVFAAAFLVIDFILMRAQGLSLIFHG